MKYKILVILLIVLKYSATNAQENDFAKYFELSITARDFLDSGKCNIAREYIDSAFSVVNQPSFQDLEKGVEIAMCLKDTQLVFEYCKMMAQTYGQIAGSKTIPEPAFLSFLQNKYEPLVNDAIAGFDTRYSSVLDSLHEEDQKIRGQGKVLYQNGINSDSLRTMHLIRLINNYGFPERSKVGIWGYNNACSVLLHSDFDHHNKLLGQLMLDCVMSGKMDAKNYASIIDRRCNFRSERPYFYQVPHGYERLTPAEKEVITTRRKRIGLRSVEKSLDVQILPNGDLEATHKY